MSFLLDLKVSFRKKLDGESICRFFSGFCIAQVAHKVLVHESLSENKGS